ncbi:MAG: tetratricopeptide repeat protein [Calditrichaeota bacterium]|nr:tetratricopeptide repeat protein [Calditrichota bacterium]
MTTTTKILLMLGAIFFLFAGYLFVQQLGPPSHPHEHPDEETAEEAESPQSELEKRIIDLRTRLQMDPQDFNLLMALGHAYLEARKFDNAAEIFELAIIVNPQSAEALVDLGIALREGNNPLEGKAKLEEAVQKFPTYADGWLQLGVTYRYFLKNNQEALRCFEEFLKLQKTGSIVSQIREEVARIKAELNQ